LGYLLPCMIESQASRREDLGTTWHEWRSTETPETALT